MTTLTNKLNWLSACSESIAWAKQFPSIESAYSACYDARWLMWLAMHTVRSEKSAWALRRMTATLHHPLSTLPISDQDREDATVAINSVLGMILDIMKDVNHGDVNNTRTGLLLRRCLWADKWGASPSSTSWKMAVIYDTLHQIMMDGAYFDIHTIVHKIYTTHATLETSDFSTSNMIPAELDRVSGLSNIVKHHIDVGDFMMGLDRVVHPRLAEQE